MDLNAIEAVLRDMRNQFIEEIPERCQRMEALTSRVMTQGIPSEAFDEIFRHVHSLKGAGGTHGLPIITSICHHFENLLTDVAGQGANVAPALGHRMLAYVDLLVSTAEAIRRGSSIADKQIELERMIELTRAQKRVALVAESSKAMQGMIRSVLERFGLKVIMTDTGIQAIIRLVHEPIDVLIVGNELNELGGQAVIAALRESRSRNHDIPVVLVKSADSALVNQHRVTAVVARDARLMEQLESVLKKILG